MLVPMSQSATLTPEQTAVLEYLVRVAPAPHHARDVSRHLELDLLTAILCLQHLRRLGYAAHGLEGLSEEPDSVEYHPTPAGRDALGAGL